MNSRWIDSPGRALGCAAVAIAAMSLLACTSMGNGTGAVSPGDAPVTFSWISKDGGITGAMSAKVGGAAFSGRFLQVTSTTLADDLTPLWPGWQQGWGDWPYWGPYDTSGFSTRYSGKVVANLKGPGSQNLRCRFHLNSPEFGMSGGGQGECQLTGGRSVDAVFPRS